MPADSNSDRRIEEQFGPGPKLAFDTCSIWRLFLNVLSIVDLAQEQKLDDHFDTKRTVHCHFCGPVGRAKPQQFRKVAVERVFRAQRCLASERCPLMHCQRDA